MHGRAAPVMHRDTNTFDTAGPGRGPPRELHRHPPEAPGSNGSSPRPGSRCADLDLVENPHYDEYPKSTANASVLSADDEWPLHESSRSCIPSLARAERLSRVVVVRPKR